MLVNEAGKPHEDEGREGGDAVQSTTTKHSQQMSRSQETGVSWGTHWDPLKEPRQPLTSDIMLHPVA